MPRDVTGNSKRRAPLCAVTKAMADAGKVKLETLVGLEVEDGVTDDQIVAEVFQAMWAVYWQQVFELQGRQLRAPVNTLILPQTGLVRN